MPIKQTVAALVVCTTLQAYAGARVIIDRAGYTGPLEIRIGIPQEDDAPQWREAKRLNSESTAEFPSLPAGTYTLLLSGDAPFERFATRIGIRGDGNDIVAVMVPKPLRIRGDFRRGGVAAGDVALHFEHREFRWSTHFSARADGTFETAVWQPGEYVLTARGGALPSAVQRSVRIDGPHVSIDLSPLRIKGVVTDTDGAPVPESTVTLRRESGLDRITLRIQADAHGMFEFADVKAGPYSISVVADGYLIPTEQPVYVDGEAPGENVGVTLSSGLPWSLRVVDETGEPVANAAIHVFSDNRLRSTTTTDAEGRATASVPAAAGTAAVWVIPRDGSFAVARLDPRDAAPKTLPIVVPRGSSSVIVDVLTLDGSAVRDIGLLMRYNGQVLLPGLVGLRTDAEGRVTLSRVPPGLYEFWPYTTAEDAAEVIESQAFSPEPAPIMIDAAEGESRATVVVEKSTGAAREKADPDNETNRGVAQ